jgi:hypothetical protein
VSVARMQFGEALAHDAGRTGDRSVVLAVLTGVLIVWTVVLVAAPSLRVSGSALRIRESTEAASALAASLTAPMTYVRFALDRERVWLFISLVFAAIAMNQFVFRAPEINELRAAMFTPTPERQDIGQLLRLIQRLFSRPDVRFLVSVHRSTVGCVVSVDTPSTMQVFHNPLSNAPKYAPDSADVELAAEAGVGVAVFRVQDHAPRVTSGSRDRLFDRSFRVEQDPETGAQGIGLYISRRIVEAQRGRIWVDGTNSGATFAITLPLCEGAS